MSLFLLIIHDFCLQDFFCSLLANFCLMGIGPEMVLLAALIIELWAKNRLKMVAILKSNMADMG